MRRLLLAVVAGIGLALAGCGSTIKSDVAALEVALTAANQAALAYVTLPACTTPRTLVLCSETPTVARLGPASRQAGIAVKAAVAAVNDPLAATGTIGAVLAAAQAALGAYEEIVATLPARKGG